MNNPHTNRGGLYSFEIAFLFIYRTLLYLKREAKRFSMVCDIHSTTQISTQIILSEVV